MVIAVADLMKTQLQQINAKIQVHEYGVKKSVCSNCNLENGPDAV